MHCTKTVTQDLTWVGGNDHRLSLFEAIYEVPQGMSYNSYLLMDDVTVLFDTVDKAVSKQFFDNITYSLQGRKLDYVVIQHMEPDHSATLEELVMRYPELLIVCNSKTATMIEQFFHGEWNERIYLVSQEKGLKTANHEFHFIMAPMVHWPEVMVTYDSIDRILFSADAFGAFGALNGAIFADEIDYEQAYMDEARRYYCNIVGKYGTQVQALLKKAAKLDIQMICPLHGFAWRRNIGDFVEKYQRWSSYTPEKTGVMIAYASVYGNTANVAEVIACRLRDQGVQTVMYDVSVTPATDIVAAAFKWSHYLFLSTTYNAGIFIRMEELLRDLVGHNLQNRTVVLVENGSWAPTAGNLMRDILENCKNMTFLETRITIKSSMKVEQLQEIDQLVSELAVTMVVAPPSEDTMLDYIDINSLFTISYGLFVVSTRVGEKENGCIINTAQQITNIPNRIAVAVNKLNYTHDMIQESGILNLSVLTESVPFAVIKQFGFQSGKDTNKLDGSVPMKQSRNGLSYLAKYTNAVISGKVESCIDCDTHTIFIAEVTEAKQLSEERSVTYTYYFDHIKPKPQPIERNVTGYVCKICGYVYEGEELPEDYICPLCKHGAKDFEKLPVT